MLKKIMKIKGFKLLAGLVCLAMVVSMLSGTVIPVANAYSNEETESTETEQRSDETEKVKEKTVSEENEDKENNENEDKEDDTEKTDNEQNIKQPEIKTFDFAKNIQFLDANECKIILKTNELITDDSWDKEGDNYIQTVSVTNQTLDLPILLKDGYYFGGWKTQDNKYIYCKQGTNSINAKDKCEINISGLAGKNIELEPIWYKYSIDITQADYDLPANGKDNTLIFSHINSVTQADINDILKTLNNYSKILKISYDITYQDDDGKQQKLTRKDVSLSLDWNWAEGDWEDGMNPQGKADFRDVMTNLETCLTSGASLTSTIRLSDAYLKKLIAQQERENFNEIQNITEEQIAFSQWGYFDTNKNNYCNGDADLSALKVQLGNTYNKNSSISGNSDYMIDTVSPSNVSIDLFDYWIDDQYLNDFFNENQLEVLSQGVNNNHGLLFRKNASEGSWNGWTGSTGGVRGNIVKSQLNDSGYPDLNIEDGFNANGTWNTSDKNNQKLTYSLNEDLSYLFDVDEINSEDYGVGYEDVKGLFKINEDGNYYYSSHDNFAEFDKENNRFNVYNTWGVNKSGSSPNGQFYPFNSANQVFKLTGDNLQQSGINAGSEAINHYLGLTMDVDFQQPVDGMVSVGTNGKPMVFDFSGDDDVWIFIDGVLVADLGGIHDEMSVSIDFSTGNINISRANNPNNNTNISTTLKAQFEKAGVSTSSFNGNTFGNNTTHQLKMFYLERGNYDSNLTLSFNLMEPMENELIKLDQNGDPVEDAEFEMYVAKMEDNQPVYDESTGTYEVEGEAILSSIKTDENGRAVFPNSYDYGTHDYYVLKEKKTPDGYFTAGDILLRYDRYEKHQDGTTTGTNLLLVDNRWTTGAVANFSASVYQSGTLNYDDDSYGEIESERGQNGLILAIPMMKDTNGNWLPLYGSNMMGYNSVTSDGTAQGQRKAILEAALYQIYHAETQDTNDNANYKKWYLEWDEENGRYQGNLNDLPGDASRYYWASGDIKSDLTMSYYFLDMESLKDIFGEIQNTTDEKFDLIATTITNQLNGDTSEEKLTEIVKALVDQIEGKTNSGSTPAFALLDVGDFNRVFASRIYVSNIQPQLGVQKLDENGNPLQGVEFTLYSDEKCDDDHVVAKGTTNENGLLVFSHNAQGSAQINFEGKTNYWLKETSELTGYKGNDEVIPVYVTANGRVYADALEDNDGITVRKGLGKLLQTMVRYAGNGDINATLRDISAKLFTVDKFEDLQQAISSNQDSMTGDVLHLHYGLSNALLEYGTHEVNGVSPNPYFEVDSGIAGLIVNQNYDAHEGDALYSTVALKTNLEDTNIRGLFTGSTVVVVQNRKIDSLGQFSITKTVSGLGADKDEQFTFDVKVTATDAQNEDIDTNKQYQYQITQKDGETLEEGQLSFTGDKDDGWSIAGVESSSSYIVQEKNQYVIKLKDNQTMTVEGLPFGLTVTVTENGADDYITSVSVNNGQWNTEKKESGIIAKPIGNPSFVFNNHKDKVTDLTITKQLPEETDSTKAFPFEITLRDQVGANLLSGEYQWKIVNADNGQDISSSDGRKTSGTITNGTLTISLKHNEKIIIKDIPVGSTYIIKETTQGYTPAVTVNGEEQSVVDGAISGTINNKKENNYIPTDVVYSNTRSGSITITKRDGYGNLLSGAGFTLYYYDDNDQKVKVGNEKYTALAVRIDFKDDDTKFDEVSMRYNDGTASYIVHTDTDNQHFYYRFLTESEIQQFYNGSFAQKDQVEAIVQFDELKLNHEYCIEETTVPNGYMQNADISETMGHIKLPKTVGEGNDQVYYYDILYTVTNHAKMVLPTTGLHGIHNILAIAIVFVVFALIVWKYRKKIEKVFRK